MLNTQCLILGAFKVFRKSTLLGMNGYDIDTVGGDMELVLLLQKQGFLQSKKHIVYEPTAGCFTECHIASKDYCINGIGGKEA